MCGIAGVYGNFPDATVSAMVDKINHRGPDNVGVEQVDKVGLGHTRLSIIDLDERSNQPLWDRSHTTCISFNGEIYNFKELKKELQSYGREFITEGDAEVIMELYLELGESFLEKLDGIFAFAMFDSRSGELIVARDRYGVKPLYYMEDVRGFCFGSEIKSIYAIPGINKAINVDSVLKTLVFLWSPGPETIAQGVFKLEASAYLIVRDGKIERRGAYPDWPDYAPNSSTPDEQSASVISALEDAVRSQLIADVPVGSFLSGGLDSSLLVAIAKNQLGDSASLDCFTIDSSQDTSNDGFEDDLPYARQVAKLLGVPLHEVKAKPDMISLLPKMIYHLDEPQADPAPLNVFLICELARKKGIKVLLSGAGGDDMFTGYRRHFALQLEAYWSFLPKVFRSCIQALARRLPKSTPLGRRISKAFSYASLDSNERILSYFYWMDPAVAKGLLTKETAKSASQEMFSSMLDSMKSVNSSDPLEKMLHLERKYFLVDHNFNYTDKMSMAHGVEVRVPFLDSRVAEAASQIPSEMKLKGGVGKWVLKRAAEKYLPKSIIYRSKSGFGAPLRHWLQNDLKGVVDEILGAESLNARGVFCADGVQEMIRKDRSNIEDYSYPIFALLCIEIWARIFIDESIASDDHLIEPPSPLR